MQNTKPNEPIQSSATNPTVTPEAAQPPAIAKTLGEPHPIERQRPISRTALRGTAAMDSVTRREVARKGGLAVSSNRAHMVEIGRKGGQSISKNREHMAKIGQKGGTAARGH